ncbi:MAG: dependent oxidoreductase [Solirubrobacterales bacterium]|nr:dependent oxidoreductase [Solirubrobacterales bacterium]
MAEILGVDRHGRAIAARAAILDLNGTIVLDERLLAGVVSDVLATVGVVVSTAEYFASFAGLSDEPLFRRALGGAGLSAADGREALARRREAGPPRRRLVSIALDDPEPVLWGGERFFRDGECVGYTTSGAYGHAVGAAVVLGYLSLGGEPVTADAVAAGRYTVNVAGADVPAHVSLRSLFDPDRRRVLV